MYRTNLAGPFRFYTSGFHCNSVTVNFHRATVPGIWHASETWKYLRLFHLYRITGLHRCGEQFIYKSLGFTVGWLAYHASTRLVVVSIPRLGSPFVWFSHWVSPHMQGQIAKGPHRSLGSPGALHGLRVRRECVCVVGSGSVRGQDTTFKQKKFQQNLILCGF